MGALALLVAVGLASVAMVLEHGFTPVALGGTIAVSLLLAIPFYFGTRDRSAPPSRTEKVAATAWMIVRRALGLALGVPSVIGSVRLLIEGEWLAAIVIAGVGLAALWAAWFGQGHSQGRWRDDFELHTENKRRYRWWF